MGTELEGEHFGVEVIQKEGEHFGAEVIQNNESGNFVHGNKKKLLVAIKLFRWSLAIISRTNNYNEFASASRIEGEKLNRFVKKHIVSAS